MLKRLFRNRTGVKSVGHTLGAAVHRPQDNPKFGDPLLDAIHLHFSDFEPLSTTTSCLQRHQISALQRAKMVDWMIEVTVQFECAPQTFFLAVTIMDSFFERYAKPLPSSELHAVGVAAMFISSKLEDVYPLRLRVVQERIANNVLSETKIKAAELTILRSLEFSASLPTPWDFLSLYFTLFKVSPAIEKTAECILRLSLLFYDTLVVLPSRRAMASLVIACTCSNRVGYVPQILDTLGVKEGELTGVMNSVYDQVMRYPETFKQYKSCARFLKFQMVLKTPGPLFQFEDEALEREQKSLFGEVASC